jgi:Leucine-rich repeat (LRR) protein
LELLVSPLNHISDLSPLSELKSLNFLELNRNRISDLTPLAGLAKLKSLDLASNQITDLTPLVGLKQLTTLSLSENPKLTRAEIDELQKALAGCKITHNAKE